MRRTRQKSNSETKENRTIFFIKLKWYQFCCCCCHRRAPALSSVTSVSCCSKYYLNFTSVIFWFIVFCRYDWLDALHVTNHKWRWNALAAMLACANVIRALRSVIYFYYILALCFVHRHRRSFTSFGALLYMHRPGNTLTSNQIKPWKVARWIMTALSSPSLILKNF